jgi:hypothetical protein
MTVQCRHERIRVLAGCVPAIAELRRLNRDYFALCPAIAPAIDALERALARLASLDGVPEQSPAAEYYCPACGATLERRGTYGFPAPDDPTDIYCGPCLQIIMPPLSTLRSLESGFGTDAI